MDTSRMLTPQWLDSLPGTMDCTLKVLYSSNLDWLLGHPMGLVFCIDGEQQLSETSLI